MRPLREAEGLSEAAAALDSVSKPIRQSELFDLVVSLGCSEPAGRSAAKKTGADAFRSADAVGDGPRLLIAEDNAVNQEVFVEVLADMGLAADVAEDGVRAVEAVQSTAYDLVLMDCQMPRMSGFEATREIRSLEEQGRVAKKSDRRLPIVALTANAMKGDREECLAVGMDDYLTKPIDADALARVIGEQIQFDPELDRTS